MRATDTGGTAWGMPVSVGSMTYGGTSLAVIDGRPAICYFDERFNKLMLIRPQPQTGFMVNWIALPP